MNEIIAKLHAAQNYLNDTDYKVIKAAEGVEAMPEDVRIRRQQCRDEVNASLAEIERLKQAELEPQVAESI